MRIAVASDDGATVAAHTGRCGGFVVFEIAGLGVTRQGYRANRFTAHAAGACSGDERPQGTPGPHQHGALLEALADCTALVTRGVGQRLVTDLVARGIVPYATEVAAVDEAAQRFAAGALQRVSRGCEGSRGAQAAGR